LFLKQKNPKNNPKKNPKKKIQKKSKKNPKKNPKKQPYHSLAPILNTVALARQNSCETMIWMDI
jgi:hypothetical protein